MRVERHHTINYALTERSWKFPCGIVDRGGMRSNVRCDMHSLQQLHKLMHYFFPLHHHHIQNIHGE